MKYKTTVIPIRLRPLTNSPISQSHLKHAEIFFLSAGFCFLSRWQSRRS